MGDPLAQKELFMPEFMFADSKTVDSLEIVPEDFRGLYEETGDGKFQLTENDQVKSAVAALTRFQTALKAARGDAKGLEEKLKSAKPVDLSALSSYGTSVEEISAAINTKISELEEKAAGSKDAKLNLDKVKDELNRAHAVELEARDNRIGALKKHLETILIDNALSTEILAQKGDVEILLPHMRQHLQSVEEDGKFSVFVVDSMKDRRYHGADPMTITHLVEEFKNNEKYSKLFASEAPSGGGMHPRAGQGKRPAPKAEELTATQKIAAGLTKAQGRR
jgi:hypothetical protein